jgi:alginate O-acetyltransferase complex protein AlgJ
MTSSSKKPVSAANAAPPVEAPRTDSLAARVAGGVLLVFMAVGLVGTLVAVARERLDLAPHRITSEAFLDGASMRDMAAALAEAPMAKQAATLERQASWLAIGDLGPQVRRGCRDWLFLAEELAPQPNALARQNDRAQAVIRIHDELRRRGIQLVVAVIPDKSRIEAGHLCDLARPAAFADRLDAWTSRLKAANVPVIDTTPALQTLQARGQEPFLRTDTHWNETGAAAAAQAIAAGVQALGIVAEPRQAYTVTASAPGPRPGDLVRLAGIDGLPSALQPAPEQDVTSRFTAQAAAGGSRSGPAKSAEDELFGDHDLPTVALLGTSFSRNSQFAEFLSAALQTPVPVFARDGGNFWGSAGAYFSSDAFKQTPPRLIVWEIPERTLQLPPAAGERWVLPAR